MTVAGGSMRQGILYDLLGRFQHQDMRDATVSQFMQRYHVDSKQARRVANLALALYERLSADDTSKDETAPHYLAWAAKLHEIGISVAYSGYHKHTCYILSNADMPGFSRDEQTQRDRKPYDRGRIHLDRPAIRIASRVRGQPTTNPFFSMGGTALTSRIMEPWYCACSTTCCSR